MTADLRRPERPQEPSPGCNPGSAGPPNSRSLKGCRRPFRHPFRVPPEGAVRRSPGVSPRAVFLRPFRPLEIVPGTGCVRHPSDRRSRQNGFCRTIVRQERRRHLHGFDMWVTLGGVAAGRRPATPPVEAEPGVLRNHVSLKQESAYRSC